MSLKDQYKPILQKFLRWGIVAVLIIIGLQQILEYWSMRNHIGKNAYASSYALRQLGEYGKYIGVVKDVKWNALPKQEKDIQGFQPRYLIARETVSGVTKEQWWCAYLFDVSDIAPDQYKPAPFPDMVYLPGALK